MKIKVIFFVITAIMTFFCFSGCGISSADLGEIVNSSKSVSVISDSSGFVSASSVAPANSRDVSLSSGDDSDLPSSESDYAFMLFRYQTISLGLDGVLNAEAQVQKIIEDINDENNELSICLTGYLDKMDEKTLVIISGHENSLVSVSAKVTSVSDKIYVKVTESRGQYAASVMYDYVVLLELEKTGCNEVEISSEFLFLE